MANDDCSAIDQNLLPTIRGIRFFGPYPLQDSPSFIVLAQPHRPRGLVLIFRTIREASACSYSPLLVVILAVHTFFRAGHNQPALLLIQTDWSKAVPVNVAIIRMLA